MLDSTFVLFFSLGWARVPKKCFFAHRSELAPLFFKVAVGPHPGETNRFEDLGERTLFFFLSVFFFLERTRTFSDFFLSRKTGIKGKTSGLGRQSVGDTSFTSHLVFTPGLEKNAVYI